MWLLVLDVIAARVIPVTGSGMFLRLVIATVQSSEGENKHMCVLFGAGQTSICAYRLALTACPGLYHAWTWLHQLYSPWVLLVFSLVRKHSIGIISHKYCLSRLFKGASNSLWLWVGPRSWLANFLMVQGVQILCNDGRYEFLTTSIAEDFITWTSKSSLTSWRWQLDWAVFQCSGDVTTRMMVVHFYLTIRHDPHRRDCRVNWRKMLLFCHWLGANILPLSG